MRPLAFCSLLIAVTISASLLCAGNTQENNKILEFVKSLDSCVVGSIYSFIYPQSHLPTTVSELRKTCKSQADAFKCTKEKAKTGPALIKRGLSGLIAGRQRHHRKYCSNPLSEISKKFIDANKCLVEKKFQIYKQIDSDYGNYLPAIKNSKFNDTKLELNHFCCATYQWKKNVITNTEPECSSGKEMVEEMVNSIVSSEIGLICEDEDKMLSKVCPKLKPLNQGLPFRPEVTVSPSTSGLYLIATLGES